MINPPPSLGSEYQPYYTGMPTFFRSRTASVEDLCPGDHAVLAAPFDSSIVLGRVGSRLGPREIREVSCYLASYYCSMPDRTIVDLQMGTGFRIPDDVRLFDVGDVDVFPIDVEATTKSVAAGVRSVVEREAIPVTLGGDHYVSHACFLGVADAIEARHPGAKIGYLHVDSHTDLADELPYTGKLNHGTCARRTAEDDRVSLEHMAWIGLNGRLVSKEQYEFAKSRNLRFVTADRLEGSDWEQVVDETIALVASADYTYVSVDIDVVDGSSAPGTGSAIFEGISARRFLALMEKIGAIPNLIGVDLCEVAPNLDPTNRTPRLAALGLVGMLGVRLFEPVDLSA